jgi:hypothetical protein
VDGQRGSAAGWLLGTLVGLVVLAAGADFGLRLWTEAWLAEEAQVALRLDQRPDVDLHGFPFVVEFLDGVFDRADLRVEDLTEEGLTIDRVTIEGRRVHFPRRAVFGDAGEASVRAEEATGAVEISDAEVSRYLEANDLPFSVAFADGRARITGSLEAGGAEVEASASADVAVERNSLVFRAVDESGLEFAVPLPTPIEGMRYRGVEIGDGTLTISAVFDRLVFRVS